MPSTLGRLTMNRALSMFSGGNVGIVPKCSGIIERIEPLPYILLCNSVQSGYGGGEGDSSPLPFEWATWVGGVHLLGGNPHAQIRLAHQLPAHVVSLDQNMIAKMSGMAIWNGGWRTLSKPPYSEMVLPKPIYLAAFRVSCWNLATAWWNFTNPSPALRRDFAPNSRGEMPLELLERLYKPLATSFAPPLPQVVSAA